MNLSLDEEVDQLEREYKEAGPKQFYNELRGVKRARALIARLDALRTRCAPFVHHENPKPVP